MLVPVVDLYWLPLGAGGWFVRLNGRVYERLVHRSRRDLYHSALEVTVDGGRWVIESTPVADGDHGAVVTGPVGLRRSPFRYELRRWRDGVIPDVGEAVDSPQRLSADDAAARRLLALVPAVPALVWGRDEVGAGDMWNSNSMVAWLLCESGIGVGGAVLPANGRAPGWSAGCQVSSSPAIRRRAIRIPITPSVER
jgi:hypothetical protein